MTTSLVPVDPSSEVAVTSYLEQAKHWLATAVENTGPEQIARAKAEIATAAEATKQLGLSKEIQLDAGEMVRRAEYALSRSLRLAQADGSVRSQGKGSKDNLSETRTKLASPYDFATKHELHGSGNQAGIYELAEATAEEFEAGIAAAKAEGNVSRNNVATKVREASGKPRKSPRRPLNESARHAGLDLMTAVERIERIFSDDRFGSEAEQVTPPLRNHLNSAVETLTGLLERINNN